MVERVQVGMVDDLGVTMVATAAVAGVVSVATELVAEVSAAVVTAAALQVALVALESELRLGQSRDWLMARQLGGQDGWAAGGT